MKYTLQMVLLLSIFWLVDSGYFLPLLLVLGALSIGLVVWLMHRVNAIDSARHPIIMLSWRLPGYLLWLALEVVKSNLEVVRCVWSPRRISPTIVTLQAGQRTDTARALYANSITMTPGTITLDISNDTFEVHALTQSAAHGLLGGEMNRRVCRLEA